MVIFSINTIFIITSLSYNDLQNYLHNAISSTKHFKASHFAIDSAGYIEVSITRMLTGIKMQT